MSDEKTSEPGAVGLPTPRPAWKVFLSGAGLGGGLTFLVITAGVLVLGLAIAGHLVLLMVTAGALLGGWFARPGGPVGFVVCAAPAVFCWVNFDNGITMEQLTNGDRPIEWYVGWLVEEVLITAIFVVLPGVVGGLIVQRKDKGLPLVD
jgi:hypothetical protein